VAIALSPSGGILSLVFGGFFFSGSGIRVYLARPRWLSFVHYAFRAIVKNQFASDGGSSPPPPLPPAVVTALGGQLVNGFNRLANLAALEGLMLFFRLEGYDVLRTPRAPRFNRTM